MTDMTIGDAQQIYINAIAREALDSAEAMLDAMSRDETTTPEQMVEAVRAMKKRYGEGEK